MCSAKRQAADYKRQGGEAKKRLEAALADQRRLALQLGRGGAAGAGRGLAALSPSALNAAAGGGGSQASGAKLSHPGAAEAAAGEGALATRGAAAAEAEAAATARRFAEQQEQLVAARERSGALEAQLRQRELLVEQQARELSSLRAQLAGAGRAAASAAAGRPAGPSAPSSGGDGAAATGAQQRGRTSSDGSEGDAAWLRLKYLKTKSALDSVAASNTRLLRELEAARAQLRSLGAQQTAAAVAAQGREHRGGSTLWAGGRPADELGGAVGYAGEGAPLSPSPCAGTAAAVLRQQLAAANHRAARLQIELDAAVAKLAIYQAHSLQGRQQQQQQRSQLPSNQPQEQQEAAAQRSLKAERVASWLRSATAAGPSAGTEAAGGALPAAGVHADAAPQAAALGSPRIPAESSDGSGLAPHENLIELHLFAAELAGGAPLGPLGLTFCTVDFWTCDTKMSGLAEGARAKLQGCVGVVGFVHTFWLMACMAVVGQGSLFLNMHLPSPAAPPCACRPRPAVQHHAAVCCGHDARPAGAPGLQQW